MSVADDVIRQMEAEYSEALCGREALLGALEALVLATGLLGNEFFTCPEHRIAEPLTADEIFDQWCDAHDLAVAVLAKARMDTLAPL